MSFTISGDASKMTSTSPLDVKSVVYGDDTRTGCPYDYVRIPGGSEDGNTHTARERYCGQSLGFCRVQVHSCRVKIFPGSQNISLHPDWQDSRLRRGSRRRHQLLQTLRAGRGHGRGRGRAGGGRQNIDGFMFHDL